jgi:hypothetical protein
MSGFGSAPAIAHAATAPTVVADAMPGASGPASSLSVVSPRVDAQRDWSHRASTDNTAQPTFVPMIAGDPSLLATAPATPSDTPLPLPTPSRPSLGDPGRQLSKTALPAPSTALVTTTVGTVPAVAIPKVVSVGLPLLSK